MSGRFWIGIATGLATLAIGCAAAAAEAPATEDWAPSAIAPNGVFYETDVASVAKSGPLVRSWDRQLLSHPQRDQASGKTYVTEIEERFDDCARRRYQSAAYVRRDAQGKVVYSGSSLSTGWVDIVPGSVADALSHMACAVASPPKDPPIQADLREGDWTDLGASTDGQFRLQVRIDSVRKLGAGPIIAVSRSVYNEPKTIEGVLVRYVVTGAAIDCATRKSASLGADLFVSPTVRVGAFRTPEADVRFEAAGDKSFLAKGLQLICAAAAPLKPDRDEAHSGLSVGTAWGADKGYLVTASHVIEGGGRIEVYNNGQKVGSAQVVADDPANDLAILKFRPTRLGKLAILPIASRPTALGREVFTLGYPEPDALGQHIKMTAGQVSSTTGYQDDARYLQVSIPIQQGNSGGPVITWDGSVVGVVEAKLTAFGEEKKLAPEMVNYALKAAYLRPMLEDLPDLANYTVVKATGKNEDLIEAARQAVFMVVVIPPDGRPSDER